MNSPQIANNVSFQSEFEHFIGSQIQNLISAEKLNNPELGRESELGIAIEFCKNFLKEHKNGKDNEETGEWDERRDGEEKEKHCAEVMEKLIELKLELEQYKESLELSADVEPIRRVRGHDFVLQSSSGRNPYCECCLGTIWRLAQHWRRCKVCGYRTHEKCIDNVRRICPNLIISKPDFALQFELCPERSLCEQNYQCAECSSPIGYDDDPEKLPRLCDYTGMFYCRRCHWNDEMVIPARLVRNWDIEKRPVCRATKQFLATVAHRPLINLERENAMLFKFVQALSRIHKLRTNIMFMKCYFVSCKMARKLRILQHLSRYQHFVETDTIYTLDDLTQLINGKLLPDIDAVVRTFTAHITETCEICRGNAFICELCSDDERIYPFSENIAICKSCCAVYHRPCFERSSKRCPRCSRRRFRRRAMLKEENEEEEDEE